MARRVRVRVAPEVLANLMCPSQPGAYYRTERGLPPDAKCVGRGHDWMGDYFWFIFEHESFLEVPEGEIPPYFDVFLLSVRVFQSPATSEDIAALNRDTAKQIADATGEAFGQAAWQAVASGDTTFSS